MFFSLKKIFLNEAVLLNVLVVMATFRKEVVGDYRYFVGNLALVDLVYALSNILSGIITPMRGYDGFFCVLQARNRAFSFFLFYQIIV